MQQLVVLDLVSDLSIGLACAAIAAALLHFARRPPGLPHARVFVAFAAFVIADGATHLAAVWSLWQPSAWLATGLKLATAMASVALALLLPPLGPKALGLGAAGALLDAAPDAMILVDANGAIRLVNERAERMFGYSRRELLGRLLHGAGAERDDHVVRPQHVAKLHSRSLRRGTTSAGRRMTPTPARSRAAIFSAAVPSAPETIAPAWPIRRPGGAV